MALLAPSLVIQRINGMQKNKAEKEGSSLVQSQLISATLQHHTDVALNSAELQEAARRVRNPPTGSPLLPHLTALCCFSALLQSLLINAI